jgi:large subunit ribosomal protein L4
LPILSFATAQPTGASLTLDDRVFSTPLRRDIIHRVIQWQEKNARDTAYKGKGRSEVQGGGRKPWRQKGTGRARAGSIRSPIWVGGGVAHPPKIKEWGHFLQKRVRRFGLRCALAAKYRDLRLTVVDALTVPEAKTRNVTAALAAHGAKEGLRALFVDELSPDSNFALAVRNVPGVKVMASVGANVRDIIMADRLFVTPAALAAITARVNRED